MDGDRDVTCLFCNVALFEVWCVSVLTREFEDSTTQVIAMQCNMGKRMRGRE